MMTKAARSLDPAAFVGLGTARVVVTLQGIRLHMQTTRITTPTLVPIPGAPVTVEPDWAAIQRRHSERLADKDFQGISRPFLPESRFSRVLGYVDVASVLPKKPDAEPFQAAAVDLARALELVAESSAALPAHDARRRDRYRLLEVARGVLGRGARQWNCSRAPIAGARNIPVIRGQRQAHYGNLQHCVSPWACPVCSAAIADVRTLQLRTVLKYAREGWAPGSSRAKAVCAAWEECYEELYFRVSRELERGCYECGGEVNAAGTCRACGSVLPVGKYAARLAEVAAARDAASLLPGRASGGVLFLTYTFSHSRVMHLEDRPGSPGLVSRLAEALVWLRKQRAYRRLLEKWGYDGLVRCLEVKVGGPNGAHPHVHEAWIVRDTALWQWARSWAGRERRRRAGLCAELRRDLLPLWQQALATVGLDCSEHRGLTVREGSECDAEYLEKVGHDRGWDLDAEIARRHQKQGTRREGDEGYSLTPWDLLRCVAGDDERMAPEAAAEEFRRYVDATKGRASLFMSKDLLRRFGVGEVTDEEAVKQDEQGGEEVGVLAVEEYRAVVRAGLALVFLERVWARGWEAGVALLAEVGIRPMRDRGGG